MDPVPRPCTGPCQCGSLRPASIHRRLAFVDPIVFCVTTRRPANKGRLAPSLNIAGKLKTNHQSRFIHICSVGRQVQGFRWERGQKKVHFSLPGAKRTGQDSTLPEPQLWQVAHLIAFYRITRGGLFCCCILIFIDFTGMSLGTFKAKYI